MIMENQVLLMILDMFIRKGNKRFMDIIMVMLTMMNKIIITATQVNGKRHDHRVPAWTIQIGYEDEPRHKPRHSVEARGRCTQLTIPSHWICYTVCSKFKNPPDIFIPIQQNPSAELENPHR